MSAKVVCLDCSALQPHYGRGLCSKCYWRRRYQGTLHERPRHPSRVPTSPGHVRKATEIGLTYRRLDYWTSQGYLKANEANPGTGHNREWDAGELAVAALMVRLIDAGLTVAAAHRVARGDTELADGIRVVVEQPSEVAS